MASGTTRTTYLPPPKNSYRDQIWVNAVSNIPKMFMDGMSDQQTQNYRNFQADLAKQKFGLDTQKFQYDVGKDQAEFTRQVGMDEETLRKNRASEFDAKIKNAISIGNKVDWQIPEGTPLYNTFQELIPGFESLSPRQRQEASASLLYSMTTPGPGMDPGLAKARKAVGVGGLDSYQRHILDPESFVAYKEAVRRGTGATTPLMTRIYNDAVKNNPELARIYRERKLRGEDTEGPILDSVRKTTETMARSLITNVSRARNNTNVNEAAVKLGIQDAYKQLQGYAPVYIETDVVHMINRQGIHPAKILNNSGLLSKYTSMFDIPEQKAKNIIIQSIKTNFNIDDNGVILPVEEAPPDFGDDKDITPEDIANLKQAMDALNKMGQ